MVLCIWMSKFRLYSSKSGCLALRSDLDFKIKIEKGQLAFQETYAI